jgi:hypothetical protein
MFGAVLFLVLLDKTLSDDGKKLPRQKARSKRTINMGLSLKYASTVPLEP